MEPYARTQYQTKQNHRRVVAPLEQLLRNAVEHGIEPESARSAAGKTPIGEICIDASVSEDEVLITVSDDGAGLDLDRVRACAVCRTDLHVIDGELATRSRRCASSPEVAQEVVAVPARIPRVTHTEEHQGPICSSAHRAAICSASFLLKPCPVPATRALTRTSTSKCL